MLGLWVQVALTVEPMVFMPKEDLPVTALYVVHRGLALYGLSLKGENGVWGEDVILSSPILRHEYRAVACTYLEVNVHTTRPPTPSPAGGHHTRRSHGGGGWAWHPHLLVLSKQRPPCQDLAAHAAVLCHCRSLRFLEPRSSILSKTTQHRHCTSAAVPSGSR